MGKHHAMFHRRQAQAANVLTVKVEVINTLDANGVIIAQETVTPDPNSVQAAAVTPLSSSLQVAASETAATPLSSIAAAPSVPVVPTALPTVPAVPPFPSDLTVPAYPFTSSTSTTPTPTPIPTSDSDSISSTSGAAFTSVLSPPGFNSTSSSVTFTSSFSSSINSSSETSSLSTTQSSTTSQDSSSWASSLSASSASTTVVSSSAGGGGWGGGDPANTASTSSSPTAGVTESQSSGNGTSLGTPEVVGTVFGSLAGAALILALLLFLLKRHKRKQQKTPPQLTGEDHADSQPMAQAAAARGSYVAPSFLNRFSGVSRSTTDTTSTGERGFQRISGRKLPSAFSEGMTSEQFARGEGTLSNSSFYTDDKGVYGGPGIVIPKDFAFAKETGEPTHAGVVGTKERVMPSPARTPVLHHPDPFNDVTTLSPPLSPNSDYPPTRGTLGRSLHSHDGSRSSRFTENV
ncbi:hypothetical protein P280DRAFT_493550 [Massarina eburnea CBS 473.64]|uniref:Uncharacterized protein n=1 Tax=Massarina eburnea CBS 473.64 TaxID=1395130 RepID=A0A6A6RKY4_9PLEO|nr:hypothetical protein P280DRAFT_493550 [Massarina eburnea CBS 473.64]